ncbi:MAG: hypothetical protein FWF00_06065 [Endomicrobia bacterium]|nr:hypothetical protein [Endomicrobiia bacterium]MCL2507231.1 hypothetical protein [Endomicrobiia bacterium]
MKKVLMFVLFAAAAAVFFAGQVFAQYYGVEVDELTAPGADINVSSSVSVTNNVFQPGDVALSSTGYHSIGGANVDISTGVNIGNVTANRNSAVIDGLKMPGGNIFGSNVYIETSGSAGNVASSENFVSVKNSPASLYIDGMAATYLGIYADSGIGNITANSNKVEIDNAQYINRVLGVWLDAYQSSSSLSTIVSNSNEISINSSQTGGIRASRIQAAGFAGITSDNNKVTISDSYIGHEFGIVKIGKSGVENDKVQANNNSMFISNSNISYNYLSGVDLRGKNVIANNNSILITNSDYLYSIDAAYIDWAQISAKANNNSVSIKNSWTEYTNPYIYGARIYGGQYDMKNIGYGGFEANNNSVRIENLENNYTTYIYGAYASVNAGIGKTNNNSVYVSGLYYAYRVYGGYANSYDGDLTTELYANENIVTIINSGYGIVYGGYSRSRNSAADYDAGTDSTVGNGQTVNYANSNKVSITGGYLYDNYIYGGYARSNTSDARANGNLVSILGSDLNYGNTRAGYVYNGKNSLANNNSVSIESSVNIGSVRGGLIDWAWLSGQANGNSVSVKNNSAYSGTAYIYGAEIFGGDYWKYGNSITGVFEANNNSVRVENLASYNSSYIYGAYSYIDAGIGKANNNTVYVSKLMTGPGGGIYGGKAQSDWGALTAELYANENTVTIVNSIPGEVYGGYSYSDATAVDYTTTTIGAGYGKTLNFANGNKVFISDVASWGGNIYGGYAYSATSDAQTNNNSASVLNSNLNYGYIYGGYARGRSSAQANNNSVSVENSFSADKITGGYVEWADLNAKANGNSVSVKNVSAFNTNMDIFGGELYGGSSTSSVFELNNNSVSVENLTFVGNGNSARIYGVYGNIHSGVGTANNNSLYIADSNFGDDCFTRGAMICSDDYYDTTAELYSNGNSATVINSNVWNIFAGHAYSQASTNTLTFAKNNTLYIKGGSFYNIRGGQAWSGTEVDGSKAQANNNSVTVENVSGYGNQVIGGRAQGYWDNGKIEAVNNTVTIIGDLNLSDVIYGGYAENDGAGGADYFTGNTLNVMGGNIKAWGIGGFQNYNLYVQDVNKPVIYVSNGDGMNALSSYWKPDGALDLSSTTIKMVLPKGAKMSAGDEIVLIQSGMGIENVPDTEQIAVKHGTALVHTFNVYVDSVTNPSIHTLNAAYVQTNLNSESKSLSEGIAAAAIVSGQGADIVTTEMLSDLEDGQYAAIGGVFGGSSKYNTGSSVKVNSLGLAAGAARKFGFASVGVYAEYVNASFDTEYNGIKGDGKASAIGGGVMAKKDINEKVYVDGLIRAGQVSNDYKTELTDQFGTPADFDHNSIYFGFALGGGYAYQVDEKISIDASGKYMFTNTGSNEVDLQTGEQFKFNSVMSNRIKLGAKGDYKANDMFTPYASLFFDYELSGDIKAKVDDMELDIPSLNGATFIFGIGTKAKVLERLTLDLSIDGYAGVRQGFSGFLKVKYQI